MPTDWKAILPTLQADQANGLGVRAIAKKHGLPPGSVSRWLSKPTGTATETLIQGGGVALNQGHDTGSERVESVVDGGGQSVKGSPSQSPTISRAPLTQLEKDKEAARKLMRDALAGKADLSAQQTSLIRLLLKDELEPEAERNPYAGRDSVELAERSIVLAVSVLGVRKVGALLRDLAQAETVDLGLDWTPDEGIETETAPEPMPKPEPLPEIRQAPIPKTVVQVSAFQVETLDG